MAFTAQDVKTLREMTNVGMMDCKKALQATDGDMEKAVDWLREKGLAKAAKKAGRVAAEGMAFARVCPQCGVGAIVEVNCETDFCAKSELFVQFVKDICKVVLNDNPFAAPTNVAYVHAGGTHGVLVNLEVEGCDATEIGKNVAMQIAAMNPKFWDKSLVPQEVIDHELAVQVALMDNDPKMAAKPQAIKEKIAAGKINAFYKENCLLQQEFVRSDLFSGDVAGYIADAAKKLGGKVKFVDAVHYVKGEGIEKKESDFAAEVAAQMNMGK